jgi:glucose uptake protein GlcU
VDVLEFDLASTVGRGAGGALAGLVTVLALSPLRERLRWQALGVAVVGAAAGGLLSSPIAGRSPGEALGMALGGFVGALVGAVGLGWRQPPSRWLQVLVVALAAAIGGSAAGALLEPIKQMVDTKVDEIGAQVLSSVLGVTVGAFVATLAVWWAAPSVPWGRVVLWSVCAGAVWVVGGVLGASLGFPLWVAVGGGLIAWPLVSRRAEAR